MPALPAWPSGSFAPGATLSLRGCGGTGRRAGFRSRWGSRPLEVRFLSPASAEPRLDLADHPVVCQLDAVGPPQLERPVGDEQALRGRPPVRLESLLQR